MAKRSPVAPLKPIKTQQFPLVAPAGLPGSAGSGRYGPPAAGSGRRDEGFKARLYEGLAVTEHWQFDPTALCVKQLNNRLRYGASPSEGSSTGGGSSPMM